MIGPDTPVAKNPRIHSAAQLGRPEEVAGAVSFLMSPAASYVTRQVIAVNGGLVLMTRVVVTGMGGVTALGSDWPSDPHRLRARRTRRVT